MSEVRPEWEGRVPRCTERCPSHDGKRCMVLGRRPESICEPAVSDPTSALTSPLMARDRERRLRKRKWERARLLAEMASTIAAGYAANPHTSGGNAKLSRDAMERAKEILQLARETVDEEGV